MEKIHFFLLKHLKCGRLEGKNINDDEKSNETDLDTSEKMEIEEILYVLSSIPIFNEANRIIQKQRENSQKNYSDEMSDTEMSLEIDWEHEYHKSVEMANKLHELRHKFNDNIARGYREITDDEMNILEKIMAERNVEKTIEFLSDNPKLLWSSNSNNNFLIHIFALSGWVEGFDLLLDIMNWNNEWMNINGEKSMAPLIMACCNGRTDIVKYLISNGADIRAKDYEDKTPLMFSSEKGYLDIVKYLISNRAIIDAKDKNETTSLIYALQNCHLDIADCLISKGANIEAADRSKITPLAYACANGHLAVVEYLIVKGANLEAKDKDGATPLMHACANDKISYRKRSKY